MIPRRLREAPPAALFFGVFTGHPELIDEVRDRVVGRYGPLRPGGTSALLPFPETRTYRRSMGPGLRRVFLAPARPWAQDALAAVKLEAIAWEDEIAARHGPSLGLERPINVDPGLVNDCRVILATTRDRPHRIYRGRRIWEEVTLIWRHGAFEPLPWTYPDFRSEGVQAYLAPLRDVSLAALRELQGEAREADAGDDAR